MADNLTQKSQKSGENPKFTNAINRTTSETMRLGEPETNINHPTSLISSTTNTRKKTPSFQITSVTVGSRISNDGGDDSADDLDESHTDDMSDVVDNSRITDIENETPSYSEDTFSKDDIFFNPSTTSLGSAPVIPTSSQYGLAIVATEAGGNILNAAVACATSITAGDVHVSVTDIVGSVKQTDVEMRDSHHGGRNERFKVVKIESTEPFKRGRWICMDYLDHTTVQQPAAINVARCTESADPAQFGPDSGVVVTEASDEPQHAQSLSQVPVQQQAPGPQHQSLSQVPVQQVPVPQQQSLAQVPVPQQSLSQVPVPQQQSLSQVPVQQQPSLSQVPVQQNLPQQVQQVQQQQQQAAPQHQSVPVQQQAAPQHQSLSQVPVQQQAQVSQHQSLPPQQMQQVLMQQQQMQGFVAPTQQQQYFGSQAAASMSAQTQTSIAPPTSMPHHTLPSAAQPPPQQSGQQFPMQQNMMQQQQQQQQHQQQQQQMHLNMQQQMGQAAQSSSDSSVALLESLVEVTGEEQSTGDDPESASGTSAVAIDNKIEQAMDLVKSHLMFAVREEVEVLKEKIAELMDRINQLELENTILKQHASQETLAQLGGGNQQSGGNKGGQQASNGSAS